MPIPDFVVELRALVGHRPLWLIGATAVVVRDEDVLLVQRSDDLEWTPVAGIVEPGEHPETTVVREVEEEAGVVCAIEHLSGVSVTPMVTYPNGDRTQYLDHAYRCRWVSGEPRVGDDESVDARWWPLADLPPMRADLVDRIRAATR